MNEEEIYAFMVSRMIDPDGLVYSAINETTAKPFRNKEIQEKVCFSHVDAPKRLWRAGFFNYEDSLMATAEFLLAVIYKYQVTQGKQEKQLAKQLFGGLKSVAVACAKHSGGVVKPMFGFLAKPYGGVKTAHLSGEVSIDQYLRVMYALEMYRDTMAVVGDKKWIDRFLLACADCWDVNNYTFNYMQGICRWGCCAAHSVAFGLYCSAVGASYDKPQHEGWFTVFQTRTEFLTKMPSYSLSDNVASLVALASQGLCKHKSSLKVQWTKYAERVLQSAITGVDETGYGWLFTFLSGQKAGESIKPHWEKEPIGYWNFMRWRGNIRRPLSALAGAAVDVYELTGKDKYLKLARCQLELVRGDKDYLKHMEPVTSADLPKGYGVLGDFICGLNTAVWLRAYWQIQASTEN